MSDELRCYRCGASLAVLTPPISQRDECPACENYVHVCRMCIHYDPQVPKKCREDDAEEVIEKEKMNFCDWYKPSATAYDPGRKADEKKAKDQLASLFGDDTAKAQPDHGDHGDPKLGAAEDLFR